MKGVASLKDASQLARNRSWRETARRVLKDKFYSLSTAAAKASKRRTILEVAKACTEDEVIFPLSVELLVDIAAVVNYTEMKAGDQYLYELKLMQLEYGFPWSEQLERHLQMFLRDKGPDDRAVEYKPGLIDWPELDRIEVKKTCPQSTALSYVWATVWMLRAIEAAKLEVGHVTLAHSEKVVKLYIPKSKMDQKASGVARSLACCGKPHCENLCPWALAVLALAKLRDLRSCAPLFPSIDDRKLSQYNLVKS